MKLDECDEPFNHLPMTEKEKTMENSSNKTNNVVDIGPEPNNATNDCDDMPVLVAEILKPSNMIKDNSSTPMEIDDVKQPVPDLTEGGSNSSNSSESDKALNQNSSTCHTPTGKKTLGGGSNQNTPNSASGSKKRKRLTPEERRLLDQERQEKRRKLEEEKQRKEQEKLEKLKIKEEERKKREEEKRLKEEEKKQKEEERLRKIEEDRVKKEEEKQRKEEERLKKEEEKKKKEEERLQKEEQRRKKEEERKKLTEEKEREKQKLEELKSKQAQLFTNYFKLTPPSKSRNTSLTSNALLDGESEDKENETSDLEIIEVDNVTVSTPTHGDRAISKRRIALTEKNTENKIFNPMPFQLKTDMNLAPLLRRPPLSAEEKCVVDRLTKEINKEDNEVCVETVEMDVESDDSGKEVGYIEELKSKGGRKSYRTEVKYESEVQVIVGNIIDNPKDAGLIKWRMKLIQFHENRRPPYWGTYKRKPLRIKGRKPFIQEQDVDYEFDSDDEWEDEPEDGEDLENSDKEDEKEPDDPEGEPEDEEDEEGWMVPHGYLSDGEGGDHVDLETMKTKEKEFYKSLKKQTLMGLPVIETEELSKFKIILIPGCGKRKIRRSCRPRKPPSPSLLFGQSGGGILSMELPNSDDEDENWTDDDSDDSESESNSSDSENDDFEALSEGELTPNEDLLSSSDSGDDSCEYGKLPVKLDKRKSGKPRQPKISKLKSAALTGDGSAE